MPLRRDADEDDAPVVGHADALDEPSLLHPVDDPGGVAERDVEQLGEPAHRQVAVVLEQPHDVHVGHAHAGLDEAARTGAAESRDHVVDAGGDSSSARRSPTLAAPMVNSSHHVNNLPTGNDRVNMRCIADGRDEEDDDVRFALMIEAQQGLTYDDQLAIVRRAEAAGFEAFFRTDHYESFPGPTGRADDRRLGGPRRPRPRDGADRARARSSRRSRSATPATSPRSSTTVDQMSGGRIEVGLGAGWNDDGPRASSGCRSRRSRSAADLLEDHLADPPRPVGRAGRLVVRGQGTSRSDDAQFYPKPVDVPGRPRLPNGAARPRLLIGGGGTPRSMRIAARYADEFNLSSSSPDRRREKYAELAAACEAIGPRPGDADPLGDGRAC